MKNAPIVPGVPNPYFMQNRVWPSRFHGPIYTRPVFGFPKIARNYFNFVPGYDLAVSKAQTPPPTAGLGSPMPQEHPLWNVGDGIFKPGGYGGGVFDGDISGLGSIGKRSRRALGEDAGDYPWKKLSEKTRELQNATNVSLKKAGMCTLIADGKLGGATCGARNFLTVNSEKLLGQQMVFANPTECDAHTSELVRPQSVAEGCGAKSTSPSSSAPLPIPSTEFSSAGMSSSTKRALGFAAGGVLALVAIAVLRKK